MKTATFANKYKVINTSFGPSFTQYFLIDSLENLPFSIVEVKGGNIAYKGEVRSYKKEVYSRRLEMGIHRVVG